MAWQDDLIISIDDMRAYCGISDSFDSNILAALIDRATDINCQKILGTALTEKLITDYNAATLTGVYDELYDSSKASVKKMVAWQAYVYGLPKFAYKIQNSGISKSGGDLNADTISRTELGDMQSEAQAAVTSYENRVKTFLVNNSSSISELQDTTPEYLKDDTAPSRADMNISRTPLKRFSDF